MKPYAGPMCPDGTPDMDSSEWETWCADHFHACASELDLLDTMEKAGLPEQLDQDCRDLVRLIHEHGNQHPDLNRPGETMRMALLRSLCRIVEAVKP